MLTVAQKGYGKRTPLAGISHYFARGGKGVVSMKTTDHAARWISTLQVTEESDVMIITHNGKVIRVHANEIREAGRSTQGVRLLRLDDDDSVAAARRPPGREKRRERSKHGLSRCSDEANPAQASPGASSHCRCRMRLLSIRSSHNQELTAAA